MNEQKPKPYGGLAERDVNRMMRFIYTLSGATQDAAAAGKLTEFQDTIREPMAQFRINGHVRPVYRAIKSVLGEDWALSGEMKDAHDAL